MLWQFDVSWQAAAIAAAALAAVSVVVRPFRHRHRRAPFVAAFGREAALVLGLFSLWQLAGDISVMGVQGAEARGRRLWHAERAVHLPSEASLQHVVLHHPLVVQFMNLYYGWLHFPSLVVFLVWLFLRYPARYARVRNTVVFFTGASLLVQFIPVAPPRLVPGLGVVDTPALYGQSVYGPVGKGIADQLSAMPSVHVGWAVLIAAVVVVLSPSRWRWLVVAHAVAIFVFVAATGNHYWLDGIVAIALLGLVVVAQWGVRALWERRQARVSWARRPGGDGGDPTPEAGGRKAAAGARASG